MSPLPNFFSRRAPVAAVRLLSAGILSLLAALPGRAAERQTLHGHVPAAVAQLTPVGRLPATQRMHLTIGLPLRNQAALADLLRQLYDPASPNYRHYLTPAQFTAEFGPAEQDYETVAAFAKARGLTVTGRSSNRVVLDVDGAVSDIEKALHLTMRVYRHPTEARDFYAPDTEPSLDLAVPISHIGGLDNYALPKPLFKRRTAVPPATVNPNTGSGPSGTYMGKDFRSAYVPGTVLTGSGQTIGLLEFDGYLASDITSYETLAGLPTVSLSNVLLDSFSGSPASADGQTEVSLDIEMAIAMAYGASEIIVYEAGPEGNFDDILNRMVSDNLAKEISSSWSESGQGDDSTADSDFQEMAAQGQSYFQASGDTDAYVGHTSSIPFPCDNPYITVVGGTTLTDSGTGGAWVTETVWNWDYDSSAGEYIGSSGGISSQYSIPSWQRGVSMSANQGSTTNRNIPDVALTANDVDVRVNAANTDVGGTSCAAPLWAAFMALVNQRSVAGGKATVGFVNPAVYTIGTGSGYTAYFHDITTGNNFNSSRDTKYGAATGYDLCTGWGTPNGTALINALSPGSEYLQVSSTTSFTSSGGQGGPFTPPANSYTLVNSGTLPLGWTASANQSWLSLSATNGTLAGSGSATITGTFNANANGLTTGTYSATITFTDLGTGNTQTGPVSLAVVPIPVITSTTNVLATEGQPFTYQITATNSPVSYGATGLPAGFSVSSSGLISGTWMATGTNAIPLTASNAAGSGTASLTVVVQTPYALWQSEVFTQAELANPAISGDTADPAGDGIPNLMKYALNLNPWTEGGSGLPVEAIATTGSGNYLALTYTQVLSAIDLTYTVKVSTDLVNWYSGAGYTTLLGATTNPGGLTESVTVEAVTPVSGNPPGQFIRLEVTGP